ncbi:MAG: ABC transporter substrate-binding protein [Actinomycetota bacterium]|nr:ABC transporter substrate-binding protein [Actinomycetota bacterium]
MKQLSKRGATSLAAGGLASAMIFVVPSTMALAAPAPAPATNASCPSTPGVTPTTVNLAMIFPVTGASSASFLGLSEGAKLRVAQENAKGGVNRRKIVVTVYDDKAEGATQSTQVNKALQQDNQFGFIHGSTTDASLALMRAVNAPVIVAGSTPLSATDRNVFGFNGPATSAFSASYAPKRLKLAGATNVGELNHNSPGANLAGGGFVATVPLEGLSLGLRVQDLPIGAYDATSTALRIRQSGINGVYLVLTPDGGTSVGAAMKQQGVRIPTLLPGLTDPAVVAKAGSSLEGFISQTYGNVPLTVPGIPAIRTYVNGMRAAGVNPYLNNGPVGYITADEFITGLKKAGKCPTRDSFVNALRANTHVTGAGLLPVPISFAPGLTPNGDPNPCSWYQTVKNGTLVPDAKATCGATVENATGKVVKN